MSSVVLFQVCLIILTKENSLKTRGKDEATMIVPCLARFTLNYLSDFFNAFAGSVSAKDDCHGRNWETGKLLTFL